RAPRMTTGHPDRHETRLHAAPIPQRAISPAIAVAAIRHAAGHVDVHVDRPESKRCRGAEGHRASCRGSPNEARPGPGLNSAPAPELAVKAEPAGFSEAACEHPEAMSAMNRIRRLVATELTAPP